MAKLYIHIHGEGVSIADPKGKYPLCSMPEKSQKVLLQIREVSVNISFQRRALK